jgi:hypothetical protein
LAGNFERESLGDLLVSSGFVPAWSIIRLSYLLPILGSISLCAYIRLLLCVFFVSVVLLHISGFMRGFCGSVGQLQESDFCVG